MILNFRKILLLLNLALFALAFQLQATTLSLEVVDKFTGENVPARVLIRAEDGKCFYPPNSILLEIGTEVWFMSTGSSAIEVPAGNITLRVERGKEYYRIKEHITIPQTDKVKKKVVLERWIDMSSKGYFSSENHLHRSAEDVAVMCVSEDLDYGTSLQWWNRPRFGVPNGDGNVHEVSVNGNPTSVTFYDVEVEEAWGAIYLINLPNPFPFMNDRGMPNLVAAKYGREKGTLNCYQSGWSREVLIDALLGFVDVVNVCNNNFHMHRYQPRSRYSNLLNVEGLPVYENTPEGMMNMNTDTYYRLLNCGLKIAAGAGSATGAKETPVGYNRAYVRSVPQDGLHGFLNAWKEGKNFVTNGPMLFLRTENGLKPGDSLNVNNRKIINLIVETYSDSPLSSLEIVVNGSIVKSFELENGLKKYTGRFTLDVSESSWISARCTDSDMLLSDEELEEYRSPRVNFFQDPNRLRFAHTSPIYFYVDGGSIAVNKSIEEGLKMIDAFEQFSRENSSEKYLNMILSAAGKAKTILMNRLK